MPLGLAQAYADAACEVVRTRVAATSLDTEQHIAHGLAWIETALEALRALHAWGEAAIGRSRTADRRHRYRGNAGANGGRVADGAK